jgi:hypothetical protein
MDTEMEAFWKNLDQELERFGDYVRLNKQEHEARQQIVETIRNIVKSTFAGKAETQIFGSFAYLPVCCFESDVDVAVFDAFDHPINDYQVFRGKVLEALNQLERGIRNSKLFKNVILIRNARVPILNIATEYGFEVDVSIDGLGSDTSLYAKCQSEKYASFALVVLFLKVLLSQKQLHKPSNGGLGSYKLYVMVAYHIHHHLATGGSDRPGEILMSFFYRFGWRGDSSQSVHDKKQTLLDSNAYFQGIDIPCLDFSNVSRLNECLKLFHKCWSQLDQSCSQRQHDSVLPHLLCDDTLRDARNKHSCILQPCTVSPRNNSRSYNNGRQWSGKNKDQANRGSSDNQYSSTYRAGQHSPCPYSRQTSSICMQNDYRNFNDKKRLACAPWAQSSLLQREEEVDREKQTKHSDAARLEEEWEPWLPMDPIKKRKLQETEQVPQINKMPRATHPNEQDSALLAQGQKQPTIQQEDQLHRDDNNSNNNEFKEKQAVVSPSIESSSELVHIQKNQQLLASQLQEFRIQQQEQNVKVLEALESLQQRLVRLEQNNIHQFDHNRGVEPSRDLVGCKESVPAREVSTTERAWKTTTPSQRSTKCFKIEKVSRKH